MKKSVELKKKIEQMKNTIKDLQANGKIQEAHDMLEEYKTLKNELELTVEIENDDENTALQNKKPAEKFENVDANVIFNKLVLGKRLTDAEVAFQNTTGKVGQVESVDARGGYLVPTEQFLQIREYMRTLNPLKKYCNVVPVNSNNGKMPLEVEADDELTNFDELDTMRESDVKFAQIEYSIANYGDIIPISNILLEDEKANLIGYIKKRFAKKAVRTENKKIIEVVKTVTGSVAGKDIKAINTALNKNLDPAISIKSVLLCNQTSFDWLDSLEDKNGRPLLTVDLQNDTVKRYKGREIIVVPDGLLEAGATKDFYVGSIEELVTFFDRKQMTLEVSKEAGFTKNATLMKPIERFDVKKVDDKAMVKVVITPTA